MTFTLRPTEIAYYFTIASIIGNYHWSYSQVDYRRRFSEALSLGFTLGEALSIDIYLESGKWNLT